MRPWANAPLEATTGSVRVPHSRVHIGGGRNPSRLPALQLRWRISALAAIRRSYLYLAPGRYFAGFESAGSTCARACVPHVCGYAAPRVVGESAISICAAAADRRSQLAAAVTSRVWHSS